MKDFFDCSRDWRHCEGQSRYRAQKRKSLKAKEQLENLIEEHPITRIIGYSPPREEEDNLHPW